MFSKCICHCLCLCICLYICLFVSQGSHASSLWSNVSNVSISLHNLNSSQNVFVFIIVSIFVYLLVRSCLLFTLIQGHRSLESVFWCISLNVFKFVVNYMLKHIDKTTLCFINKDCVERKEFYFDLNVKLNLSSLSLRWALVLWPGTFDNKPLHIFNPIFVGIQENLIFYSKSPVTDSVRSIVHSSRSSLV